MEIQSVAREADWTTANLHQSTPMRNPLRKIESFSFGGHIEYRTGSLKYMLDSEYRLDQIFERQKVLAEPILKRIETWLVPRH